MKKLLNISVIKLYSIVLRRNQLIKQSYWLVMLITLISNPNFAATISEEKAKVVAQNFLKSEINVNSLKAILNFKQIASNGSVDFYIFNFLNRKSFVIVSGDDKRKPIIAYSTTSAFNIESANKSGVSFWMNKMQKQIEIASKENIRADKRIADLWSAYLNGTPAMHISTTAVNPLLTTTWSQGTYYNTLCPYDNVENERCVTGCVATAMAQIMKFWNYPEHGTGSHSYSYNNYGTQSANFGSTYYNWSMMPPDLDATSSNDVATLMYHCGVALEMDYELEGNGGSGAKTIGGSHDALNAYVTYFGYSSSSIEGKTRLGHSNSTWIGILKDELNEGRPVHYRGTDPAIFNFEGHSWVVDGYDSNDLFHMNWGWGWEPGDDDNNGFYDLNDLTPDGSNFNGGEKAIVGISPPDRSDCESNWNLAAPNFFHFNYTLQASDYITSSANLNTLPATLTYTAENKITLTEGFLAGSNVVFTAMLQSCNSAKVESPSANSVSLISDENKFILYPNPASNQISIKFENDAVSGAIEIINTMSQLVLTKELEIAAGDFTSAIDISRLIPGTYFLRFIQGQKSSTSKFIKF